MLVYQGAEAFRLWTGIEPPVELMKKNRSGGFTGLNVDLEPLRA